MSEASNPSERKTRYLRPSTTEICRARSAKDLEKVTTRVLRAERSACSTDLVTISRRCSTPESLTSESGSRVSRGAEPAAALSTPRTSWRTRRRGSAELAVRS
jgi:hypothetical protein